ncbi:MAG: nickel pincer cofactor biosynthesis protein LarC, partial [Pseudoflavonifractor sp.]
EHDHTHDHTHDHHHHSPAHIGALIDTLPLPESVRVNARAVYDRIAAAEAAAHGCAVGEVHFHEVGALDAVCDVVGVCYALHLLAPDKIIVSPVHVGCGQVRCAHGLVPVPAPATALLLQGIPSYGGTISGELCTPTGAALLAQLATEFGPMPPMAADQIGYGIGSKEFPAANCVRAFLGECAESGNGAITELVCNLDDMTPEALAFACTRLLEGGALDCYTVPGTMKKGRTGQVLTVLCAPEDEGAMARKILRETSTNGLRVRHCEKYFMSPWVETVQTTLGPIRIKGAEGWGAAHRKPEYADVAAAADRTGLPFGQVWNRIMEEI